MERRTFITTSIAATSSILVAGCSGSGQAAEHLETAYDAIENANGEIESESERLADADIENGDGVDIQTNAIFGHLDTASTELDQAEETASDDQQEQIDGVRSYVTFARASTEFIDLFADAITEFTTGLSYFKTERYADARDRLESTESMFEDVDSRLNTVRTRYDDLDTDVFNDVDRVSVESFQEDIDKLEKQVPALEALTTGVTSVSVGMIEFKEATTNFEDEQYTESESKYEAARDEFATAHSTFSDMETEAPTEVQSTFVELTCTSGGLRDASQHYANAANAMQSGNNQRAQDEIDQASGAMDQCDY
ncbi:hypothetical protein OB920_16400 [Halobacteria archaeon HArc-gm2]|nr:hypothetical protein [Halobacteria archaeon HArc-gm2]